MRQYLSEARWSPWAKGKSAGFEFHPNKLAGELLIKPKRRETGNGRCLLAPCLANIDAM